MACNQSCNICNSCNSEDCSGCEGCNTCNGTCNATCNGTCQVCQSLCQNSNSLKTLFGEFSFSPTPEANKTIFHKDAGTNHFTRSSWQAIIDHINKRNSVPASKITGNIGTTNINAGSKLSDCTDTYFTHTEFNKVRNDIATHMTGATAPQVSQYQLIKAEFFTKLVSDVNKMTVSDACSTSVSCKECQDCVTNNGTCKGSCNSCNNGQCGSCLGCQTCKSNCNDCVSCQEACEKSAQSTPTTS